MIRCRNGSLEDTLHAKRSQSVNHIVCQTEGDPLRNRQIATLNSSQVGLGDRHGSNIMINTKTGEILHIDLGIAFDQVSMGRGESNKI
jgi:hypothetical protein